MKIAQLLFVFLLVGNLNAHELNVIEKRIIVNGKEANIYAIVQPDGTYGLRLPRSQPFDVILKNTISVPTSVHWHGLILPNNQDGVAFVTQYALYPSQSYHYHFPLVQAGTFWMHSHVGLQEQRLLSAPLIITEPEDAEIAQQEVVVFLSDFSFSPPSAILENLRCKNAAMSMPMPEMKMPANDIVEVDYDAFLANHRTLENPEVITVTPSSKVRLRCINGSSATNYFLNLGKLSGEAMAVDGNRIHPYQNTVFELAVAQRIDIVITIPKEGGVFPIFAQAEGTNRQTGLVLATTGNNIPRFPDKALAKAGPLTNAAEKEYRAMHPLPSKKTAKTLNVDLGGSMVNYHWTINNEAWPESTPLIVEKGQRVEIVFKNTTTMSHPMHLHGHVFQITAIDGKPIEGAMRDTVLVPAHSSLAIQFDADNPGVWPLHCHILYHMEAGMFTVLRYAGFQQPL